MKVAQLRTLIAIVDAKSFASAAEQSFITPSAISHQMRKLESELGVELFDRATRPPTLNSPGYAVVERGREVLARLDTLVELARSPGEIGGRLMLGCVSGVSSDLIPLALARLRTSHPLVQVTHRQMETQAANLLPRLI